MGLDTLANMDRVEVDNKGWLIEDIVIEKLIDTEPSMIVNSFLTYRSCRHLDGKHTVFGRVVGGLDTLANMERVEVDNKDRPIEDIVIEKAQVFVDPYQEADDQVRLPIFSVIH